MAGFFPTGPDTTVYGLILLSAVVFCLWHGRREIRHVAGAMFLSWIVARSATYFDAVIIQVVGTFAAALIALWARDRAGDLVAILFAFKLPFYLAHGASFWVFKNIENMWLASEIVGYFQIAIMSLGGLTNGTIFRTFDRIAVLCRIPATGLLGVLETRIKRVADPRRGLQPLP